MDGFMIHGRTYNIILDFDWLCAHLTRGYPITGIQMNNFKLDTWKWTPMQLAPFAYQSRTLSWVRLLVGFFFAGFLLFECTTD